jgi:hypothetical protein
MDAKIYLSMDYSTADEYGKGCLTDANGYLPEIKLRMWVIVYAAQ